MKNLLFYAKAGKSWMGGIYYIKNMLNILSFIPDFDKTYNIYLCIDTEFINEFSQLNIEIHYIKKSDKEEQILEIFDKYKIDIVMPVVQLPCSCLINEACIYWIPDFQEIYYPENFSLRELKERSIRNSYMAENHKQIILSSKDALADYNSLYSEYNKNVSVVHFSAYIEDMVSRMSDEYVAKVMKQYDISFDYIFTSNQFWKHKNHEVLFRAISFIKENYGMDIHLVCTGFMNSYGKENDEYVEKLMKIIETNNLEGNIHLLGLIGREEQLAIMRNADALIQPSLFEGWGSSVEEAKVMGKYIVASDLEVHKEQANENVILFKKNSVEDLAKKIVSLFPVKEKYNDEKGKKYYISKTREYAEELRGVLECMPKVKIHNAMERLCELRRKKILQLFGSDEKEKIGIYGVGKQTDIVLGICRELKIQREFIFFDSDENKWGRKYREYVILSPGSIPQSGVRRIIISSLVYQEEIYDELIQKEIEGVDIIKMYDNDLEKQIGSLAF